MKRTRLLLAAFLATALMVVAFQAYPVNASSGSSNPNPVTQYISVTGTMSSAIVAPTCANNNPPCALVETPLYWLTVNGWYYRLIFPPSMKIPLKNAQILVSGQYVTPSTYQPNQWMGSPVYFGGDIYVISYTYVTP